MSGWPRWASDAPSHRCTSAWTIACGWTTTSIRSYGTPNKWCASISSRPLFISVDESIVILPPIAHVGCLSASSTVTLSSCSRERPRNGPPLAVSTSLATVPGASPAISWCSAECSESTGITCPPVASESCITSSPPTTRDSLLASARSMPSPSVATVGPSPAEPTSAFKTRSAPESTTSCTSPSGPASTAPDHSSRARSAASASVSATRSTANSRACAISCSQFPCALSPTSSSSSECATISSAWVPMDPVEPRMRRRRDMRPLASQTAVLCGRMGRGPAVAAIAAAAALCSGSAPAASTQVAGPTASGATLRSYHEGGELCITVMVSGSNHGDTCNEAVPRLVSDTMITHGDADAGRALLGGAAPQEVSRIQAVQADGTVTDAPARPSAGEPGATFFLVELDRAAHGGVRFVRLFDAAGTELGAAPGEDELPSSGPVTVGRVGHLRAIAYDAREFEPSPIAPERVRHYLCVALRRPGGTESLGGHCLSRETVSGDAFSAEPSVGSCGHGDTVVGLGQRRGARMRLILGDGTSIVMRPRQVPLDPPQGMRAFFAVAPRSAAMRRVEALDDGGRRIGREQLGIEPATSACSSGLVNVGFLSPSGHELPKRGPRPPDGPALAVRVDGAERLCVGVDEAPAPPGCGVPAAFAVYAEAQRDYDGGTHAFAGLVDPHVATVTAILSDGRQITAATSAAPAAAGPYQPVSRSYLIEVSARVGGLRYSDAQGHVLWESEVATGLATAGRPRVVLRDAQIRLAVARERHGRSVTRFCADLLIGDQRPSIANCHTIDQRVSTATVSCATHRIAIYGRLGRTPRAVEAITAGGGHVAGPIDRRTRAFLIVLPAHEGLRELHVAGRRGYRARHDLPAGTQQCGYTTSLFGAF